MIAVSRDLDLLVLVAVLLPERRVREVDVGRDHAEQLGALATASRYCASSAGEVLRADAEVSQRWYLPRSNWLSVWNSGTFWNSGGGEFRIASTISSSLTVMPRRLYSRLEHTVLDELLPDLVTDLLVVLEPERARRLPLAGVDALLHHGLVGAGVDAAAVDLADRGLGEQTQSPPVMPLRIDA